MSTVLATTKVSSFSCHCLNVLVQISGIDQLPPFPVETGYLPVHVRDEGIQIAHDQFTSRTHGEVRQSEVPQRSVTLTCLMCNQDVYRVWWDHRPSEDAPTTPKRVTTEGGILQSTSGWIEIKQTCLSGEAIQRLVNSPEYSPLFRVMISRENPTPPASLSSGAPITAPPLLSATPPSSPHLPDLPPLFLPPPFTPGHAAFVHLRALATEQSLQLRHRAEAELVAATKKKLAELEEAEQELKRQVLVLWRAFRNHVGEDDTKAQQQPADGTNVRSSINSTRVIRDFSPQAEGDVKWNPTPSKVNHSSALSQSMRTSAMHYTPKTFSNDDSANSGVAQSVPFEAPSKRWMTTEDTNVAASLHWSKMEENMRGEEEKRERGRKANTEVEVIAPSKTPAKPESETSQATGTAAKDPKNKDTDVKQGSRKVQFDVKPTIASGSERIQTDATKAPPLAPEESVFDIEFEDSEPTDASTEPVEQVPTLQATNGSSTLVNARRKHKTNPLSFSSLRPSSLPAPSVLNAAFKPKQPLQPSNPASASSSSDINSQPQSRLASLPSGIRNHVPHQPLDDNEETQSPTIADGPSSVPSGSKNGRSWAIFTRNKGGKMTYPEDTVIAEEVEDELTSVTSKSVVDPEEDDSTTQFPSDPNSIDGVPRSMPIPTGIPGARAFEDTDYEAKTSLTDRPGHRVPKLHTAGLPSSVAIRKALYAQRDRQRGTDPGSFDDIGEEDEGDDSDQDDETLADGAPTERSRQKAFKILKAREELPAAGMWRSLAN